MSFGIPMMHRILEWKETIDSKNVDADGKSGPVDVESIYLDTVKDSNDTKDKDEGSVDAQDEDDDCGSVDDHQSQDDDDDTPGDEEGAIQSTSFNTKAEEKDDSGKQPLLGLVLTPTRELAVQVKHHIDAVAQFTGL